MRVREVTAGDAGEVLALVRAKAQFDRELGAFGGELGTTEELIRRHLFGSRPSVSRCTSSATPRSGSCCRPGC